MTRISINTSSLRSLPLLLPNIPLWSIKPTTWTSAAGLYGFILKTHQDPVHATRGEEIATNAVPLGPPRRLNKIIANNIDNGDDDDNNNDDKDNHN